MADESVVRAMAEQARTVAARELRHGELYSALVDLCPGEAPAVASFQFGFQELTSGLMFGKRLKTCFIEVSVKARSARMTSAGTYGPEQFKTLAETPGLEFPPPALDLRGLQLEVEDVWRILQTTSPFGAKMGEVALSIFVHEGRLAWRALQDVDRVGFRTLFLDAGDGHVLYEKVDRRR